ncbi:MAG: GNAT family N-acetyltransferase [Bacteroidota bacterium]
MMPEKNSFILATPRLLLRELTPADATSFFELNNDPEVIKFTGDPPFSSRESARIFLENYDQYACYGYGRWAVILKETGEFLGWCGLKFSPEMGETDIGFRFFRKHWGKGFATEAAAACLDFGFEKLGLEKIVGRAMKENLASVRVLEKIGMQFDGEMIFERHPGVLYSKVKS